MESFSLIRLLWDSDPMLAGNVAALLSPMVFIPIFTLVFGEQNYDYKSMRAIRKVDDSELAAEAHVDLELIPGESSRAGVMTEDEELKLNKAAFYARVITVVMTLCLLVFWPMPMYGTSYVFSKRFFTGWVVVGIIWLFCSAFGVIIFPLYEGRDDIVHTVRALYLDLTGKRKATLYGREGEAKPETTPGELTPQENVFSKN
jgi:urea-proton symporter